MMFGRFRGTARSALVMVALLVVSLVPGGVSSASAVRTAVVSVSVAPAVVSAGVPVRVSGVLRFVGGGSGAGRIVSVFVRRPVAGAAWSHAGSVRTDARGSYNFRLVRQTSAQVQVRFAGGPGLPKGISSVRSLAVRGVVRSVSVKGVKSPGVVVGDRLTFTARASAGLAGGRASIQVLRGSWREVAAGKVRAGGVVGVVFAPAVGAQRYRLVVQGSADLTSAATGPVGVRTYPRTKVSYVTPFRSDGWLRLGTDYDSELESDTCRQSAFTPYRDVYQCGYTYQNLHACWQRSPSSYIFVCMANPTDKTASNAYGKLAPTSPDSYSDPWTVRLADGSTCLGRIGGAWSIPPDGYNYTAECSGPTSALFSKLGRSQTDKSRAAWTVYYDTGNPSRPVAQAFVTSVVYAGARPAMPRATRTGCPTKAQLAPHLPAGYRWNDVTSVVCAGGWSAVAAHNVSGDYGEMIVFKPVGKSWQGYNRNVFCPGPSAMPADLWDSACNVG